MTDNKHPENTAPTTNFIRNIIDDDIATGKHSGIITRFPPEPNGYLHIGHAKSICLNFGIAEHYQGHCNLRFDDTNPEKESEEYMHSIREDVEWLGFEWSKLQHASDYFEQLYHFAIELIKSDKAYVEGLSADEIREYRGTLKEAGKNSPYRDRPTEESLDLFTRMKAGEFTDGEYCVRAKIDMAAPNINMRDPVIYRIKHMHHIRTGDEWCIYPMYDFAHCLSDAIEGITHSLCTLEFADHRPLYDWVVENVNSPSTPRQYEFSRLNLSYTITSKRKLNQLVSDKHVESWDDPRMTTLSGLRRRGYTPNAIRTFCERIGISKNDSVIDMSTLEDCLRDDLNQTALRRMAVLDPIKVVIDNFPADDILEVAAANNPNDESTGKRKIPFTREIYIDANDFMVEPARKYFRLAPDREVRLRGSYIIKCHNYLSDDNGKVTEIHCTYDPETLGKMPTDRKVKGVIHWVSASECVDAEIRLYERLFNVENPATEANFLDAINPDSLDIKQAKVEPILAEAQANERFQFERVGYFCADKTSTKDKLVFNRTVTLRDNWAKKK